MVGTYIKIQGINTYTGNHIRGSLFWYGCLYSSNGGVGVGILKGNTESTQSSRKKMFHTNIEGGGTYKSRIGGFGMEKDVE